MSINYKLLQLTLLYMYTLGMNGILTLYFSLLDSHTLNVAVQLVKIYIFKYLCTNILNNILHLKLIHCVGTACTVTS